MVSARRGKRRGSGSEVWLAGSRRPHDQQGHFWQHGLLPSGNLSGNGSSLKTDSVGYLHFFFFNWNRSHVALSR